MNNIEEIKRKLTDNVGNKITDINFVKSTINDRPWFFGGLTKVIEGGNVDEINVSLDHGVLVIDGKVTENSKLIPHETDRLFIYEPALSNTGVSIDSIVQSITYTIEEQNLIKEKRPFDILKCLLTSVDGVKTSDEFMKNFIGKLVSMGEIKLSSKKIQHLIVEVMRLLDLTQNNSDGTSVVNHITGSRIVLEFVTDADTIMLSTFPLTHKGFYGFSCMLNMISKHNNFKLQ